jgi:hypothetical protein
VGCGEVRRCRVPYYRVGREAEAAWKGGAAGGGVRPVRGRRRERSGGLDREASWAGRLARENSRMV